jgi:nucleoside-diphosphate-sugar epimerase
LSKKILIIGGTGFLGYHLAKKCLSKKWDVTSISTNRPKKVRFLPKVKYLILDIANKKLLLKKIKSNYDYIVNLGCYVNHNEKLKTYQSHYNGSKNLIDFFLNKKIKSFLQVGSCVEYGKNKSPQNEKITTNIKDLKSSYGRAKLSATNYLLKKKKINNFPGNVIRLYLVYGPRQDFNRFIPLIIKGCLGNSNFPCSSGKQFRDFLYIDDAINAIIKCLIAKNLQGEVLNIGSGKPKKIKKVIYLIKNLIKLGNPSFGKIKMRSDEIYSLYPNIKKANKKIDWMPKVKFNDGIAKTINFYKKIL